MAAVKRNKPAANSPTPTLRHLWLAGLGLAVIARREALASGARTVDGIGALQRRAQGLVADARDNVRGGIESVRGQVEPTVVKFSAEVEARLAPVLDKLGLKGGKKQRRGARKPRKAAKPAQARRGARKPAPRRTRRA
ncbi:hypothetical protein ABU614_19475 [Lysobacter firmicutimachus]|uniref:Poly(Hydroxyalcanoate) granule associated protein n=1 Tax=Lysobacter firmicutimachus TaxID=1792846 RepID=A0AAU8MT27_9GAMM